MPHLTRQSFLLALSDALRPLATPHDIHSTACRMIAEQLGGARVTYCEIEDGVLVLRADSVSADGSGGGEAPPFGTALLQASRFGGSVSIDDVGNTPRLTDAERQALVAASIGAFVGVTLVQDGRWVGALGASSPATRPWAPGEVELLQEAAARVAYAAEHATVESALAESERRLGAELADARTLAAISTRLISESRIEALYTAIVEAAVELMDSDFASLQMLEPDGRTLALLAWKNFHPESAAFWSRLEVSCPSCCGQAASGARRVVIPDVEKDELTQGTRHADEYRRSGIRAVQSTPLVSRTGRPLGMISTHWRRTLADEELSFRHFDVLARQAADLIERTTAQDALLASEERLRDADRRKDEFIAVLAHELRNPLAPLRTGLELLRHAGGEPETVDRVRSMMDRQVGQMIRLIDDLLDVSRITAGRIQLRRQASELATMVATAVEANRARLQEKELELRVELPPDPVWLDVDSARFVQVLSNVLHNAVKFTATGGRVEVRGDVESRADGAPELRLVVADNGAGISPEILPRIFDLFTQGESAPSQGGLGIGLALARRLIEMHGGTIEASSDGPGLGSRFTLRTAAIVPGPGKAAGTATARPNASERRVLIIDDNADAATALAMLVSALGGSAAVAADGEQGLEVARTFKPELVLLDIGMPGLNGYETCQRLRLEHGSGLMIVALTGWGQERDKELAMRAGFDLHLTKPAHPLALEALLTGKRPGPPRGEPEHGIN